jgi:hypothetical protein
MTDGEQQPDVLTWQQHMEALKIYELELAIGGFDSKSPWKKEVGLTRPYFEERFTVGVPATMRRPDSIRGLTVQAKAGEPTAGYVLKKGGSAQRIDTVTQINGPFAGPDWQLEKLGLIVTPLQLHKTDHVVATPPGENGWIKRLEEFLFSNNSSLKGLLQQESGL